jgi:hypothetical protein
MAFLSQKPPHQPYLPPIAALAWFVLLEVWRKLPSTDLSTGTVWAFNSPEMILQMAK